jgi:3-isopropylmalate/(R)-2-methylmalate dehydratase small subunit
VVESFVRVRGIAAPLLRINIDTDQIIPGAEIMRSTEDTSERWGSGLFANWRYLPDRRPNPDFVLNQEPWSRAKILLADRNFGCGSSREAAPQALRAFGFRAVIAPSFGGIFFNNSFRHGLLPVELPIEAVEEIAKGRGEVAVDLENETVTAPDGKSFPFRTPPALRRMLLEGLDEIGFTLSKSPDILAFRQRDRGRRPWAYRPGAA